MTDILDLEGKEYEMTYEDWWLEFTSVHPDWRYADSEALRKAAFESGAASRDAEIAKAFENGRQAEREACLNICINHASDYAVFNCEPYESMEQGALSCALTIRARGEGK